MEAKELKLLAAGRWESIVASLAPQLGQAVERTPNHVPCPVHGGIDGFRLFRDFDETGGGVCNTCGIHHDGYSLLMWANGWDFLTTHHAIHDMLLGSGEKHYAPLPAKKPCVKKEENMQDIRDSLNHVWKASVPLTSPEALPARLYFANRGIGQIDYRKIDGRMIRFIPSLEYYEEGKLVGTHPAIVTMVCDASGRPSTVHRSYITRDGEKADVPSPKKMMRHCADNLFGAMRIATRGDNSRVLAITEGIETALAVMGAFNVPVWAAGNAYLLENFVPPKGVDVVIYADKDRPSRIHPDGHGLSSAKSLVKRLWKEGVKASIKLPDTDIPQGMKSVDWLDVVNGGVHQAAAKKTATR